MRSAAVTFKSCPPTKLQFFLIHIQISVLLNTLLPVPKASFGIYVVRQSQIHIGEYNFSNRFKLSEVVWNEIGASLFHLTNNPDLLLSKIFKMLRCPCHSCMFGTVIVRIRFSILQNICIRCGLAWFGFRLRTFLVRGLFGSQDVVQLILHRLSISCLLLLIGLEILGLPGTEVRTFEQEVWNCELI